MPDDLPALIAAGRAVKRALEGTELARHPADERLSGIYGTILYEDVGPLHQRNVDDLRRRRGRSLALRIGDLGALRAAGRRRRASGRATSCATTRSSARPSPPAWSANADEGVLTEVEGMAYRTGEHRFVLDPRDPLGTGFVLR